MRLLKITTALFLLMFFSCQKGVNYQSASSAVQLNFSHMAGTQPLAFGVPNTSPKGEDFTVTTFKYYISNVTLIDSLGVEHRAPDSYFLIDEATPDSKTVRLQADGASFSAIQFLIGVDSIRNVSGAQTGALDPALEMFWTWNSGYIMAKLEGTSSLSTLPNNRIEYQIGGFAGPDKALRTITLPFGHVFDVSPKSALLVNLKADVMAWFSSVHDLRIQANPACTTPGALAHQYADNYAKMFSISSVQIN